MAGHIRTVCHERRQKANRSLAFRSRRSRPTGSGFLSRESSRHLTNDSSRFDKRWPNGYPVAIKTGNVTQHVTACGMKPTVEPTELYYGENLVHNLISNGGLTRRASQYPTRVTRALG
ncbi:LOW QUALITY PROTEIN: hypothetical protein PHMEG_00016540 [Phytophthora megakarya]|uniref:Uncharacterized protein n=1 Tax=Phytophthora megakarya TaxID=4795 RepID=A0A225VYS8_9STRA|nr:LOW QUALITY PROTEIN: hypothetical protein PHMEG_00016540 [Phytophthora megakarya]